MRLIIKLGANYYYENLLISNKVIAIILDEYINISRHNLVFIVYKASRDYSQIYIVNVIYTVYISLHYVLLFLYGDPGWHYSL
jgi:hypothetical protein